MYGKICSFISYVAMISYHKELLFLPVLLLRLCQDRTKNFLYIGEKQTARSVTQQFYCFAFVYRDDNYSIALGNS